MIITLEGLSCAGKTALSTALYTKYPDYYVVIPEFILPLPNAITTAFCKENDIAKAQLAAKYWQSGKVVLMDRGWMSTVVYEYAQTKTNSADLVKWYDTRLKSSTLRKTDKYVYLRLSPDDAIARAKSVNRFNDRYAWYSAPDWAATKYDELFRRDEFKDATITLNAMDPFDDLMEAIHGITAYQGR